MYRANSADRTGLLYVFPVTTVGLSGRRPRLSSRHGNSLGTGNCYQNSIDNLYAEARYTWKFLAFPNRVVAVVISESCYSSGMCGFGCRLRGLRWRSCQKWHVYIVLSPGLCFIYLKSSAYCTCLSFLSITLERGESTASLFNR